MEIKKLKLNSNEYCIECNIKERKLVEATWVVDIGNMVSKLCDNHIAELKELVNENTYSK